MKREQIIEFAKKHIYIEYKKAGFGTYQELGGLEEFADAILALLPTDDDAGIIAVKIASTVEPKLTAQEEAFFVAGFQECVKYLKKEIKP